MYIVFLELEVGTKAKWDMVSELVFGRVREVFQTVLSTYTIENKVL